MKWIHALSAGVEKVLSPELIESPVPLTNGRGVFGPALAEFAIASMLFFAKDLRRLIRQQEAARWEQFDVAFLREQTLGVIGYGGIGRETARLAHALGMKVHGSSPARASSENDPHPGAFFPREQLNEMLSLSDYVLAAAPLTPETQGMIGRGEFHFMKNSAVFINVGRGAVVVESALISAFEQGPLAGAALDVFDTEPLPSDHPFYRMENVLLSPHSADHTTGWMELAVNQFIENFERFRNGQPLRIHRGQAGWLLAESMSEIQLSDIQAAAERTRGIVAPHAGLHLAHLRRSGRRARFLQVRKLSARRRVQDPGRVQLPPVRFLKTSWRAAWSPSRPGNHGQAVAIAAESVGTPATIVMPADAPASKVAATRGHGAQIVSYDRATQDREAIAQRIAKETGATVVPPYDHPWTIAGQGTVALELLDEIPDLDALVIPIGGGGLISGSSIAAHAIRLRYPHLRCRAGARQRHAALVARGRAYRDSLA